MRQPKGFLEYGQVGCCPKGWEHVPNITGDYVMDGSIQRCKNRDLPGKIQDYLVTDVAYKINTAYGRGPI